MKLYFGTLLFNFTLTIDRIIIQPSDSDGVWNVIIIIMYSFGILIINSAVIKNMQIITEMKKRNSNDES